MRHKHCGAVRVGGNQRTRGSLHCIAFSQSRCAGAAYDCLVIGTVDSHGHDFDGTVSTGGVKAVCISNACFELVVRRVHGVSPLAHSVDAELAVAAAAVHIGLRGKACGAVLVYCAQHTSRCLYGIGLGQCRGADAADHGRVIGTDYADRHHLGYSICGGGGEAVGVGRAGTELVVRGVHHIGPLAARVHAEFAVAACAVDTILNSHGGRAVHIGDEQLTSHRLGGIGFCQGRGAGTGDS